MKELLLATMMMASRLSGLPIAEELPTMHFLPQDQLCVALELCDSDFTVGAHYDMRTRTLTLPTTWSPTDPRDLGALVHEMVHHLQAEQWPAPEDRPCDGEIERGAYGAEHKFLKLVDLDPEVGLLLLIILTSCED